MNIDGNLFLEQIFAEAALYAWNDSYDAEKDVFRFASNYLYPGR